MRHTLRATKKPCNIGKPRLVDRQSSRGWHQIMQTLSLLENVAVISFLWAQRGYRSNNSYLVFLSELAVRIK